MTSLTEIFKGRINESMAEAPAKSGAKEELKKVLDSLQMEFPSCAVDRCYKRKTLLRKKAISGGSSGPMTSTNAHMDRNRSVEEEVTKAFTAMRPYGLQTDQSKSWVSGQLKNLDFIFMVDEKTQRTVKFSWEQFPTNSRSRGYDSSYQSYWFVMNTVDEKIKKPKA